MTATASAADALVMVPAFLPTAGAGEVTDPAGAVGAPALPVGTDTRQQPVDAAALTNTEDLAGLRVAP